MQHQQPDPEAPRDPGFTEEGVEIRNGAVSLAGTLLLPLAGAPHPAVVLVHGSGASARDEWRPEAEHFARHGIAALIYDKRGAGASTGDWSTGSFAELAADALACVAFLRRHAAIRPEYVGLWGLSEGGWVAPLAASRSPEVAFLITVSAPGVSPARQELYRRKNVLRAAGKSPPAVALGGALWNLTCVVMRVTPHRLLPPGGKVRFFSRTLDYDPVPAWERIAQPVLGLWGAQDGDIPVEQSVAIIDRALRKAGNVHYTLRVLPDANHRMEVGRPGPQREVKEPGVLAPDYLAGMVDWLLGHVLQ